MIGKGGYRIINNQFDFGAYNYYVMSQESSESPMIFQKNFLKRAMSSTQNYYPGLSTKLKDFHAVGVNVESTFYFPPPHQLGVVYQKEQDKEPPTMPTENITRIKETEIIQPEDHPRAVNMTLRPREKNPPIKNDYPKNITKNIVHASCRDFKVNKHTQRQIKNYCDKENINISDFEALLDDLHKEYHISNGFLYTYLRPRPNDPRFAIKQIFRNYFNRFLDLRVPVLLITKKMKVEKPEVYLSYMRKYLCYLSDSVHVQVGYVQYERNNNSC